LAAPKYADMCALSAVGVSNDNVEVWRYTWSTIRINLSRVMLYGSDPAVRELLKHSDLRTSRYICSAAGHRHSSSTGKVNT
jgi:hypothetical protein